MKITCEFKDGLVPIGTKVYIPRPPIKGVWEDEVVGYYCILRNDEAGNSVLLPTDYKLRTANLGREELSDAWKRNEFFLSYEEAKSFAIEYPITATDEEWMTAIGLTKETSRQDYDDNCELSSCCATISDIRSLLHNVCMEGHISRVERRNLISLLENHTPPSTKPNLDKILAQIEIVWNDKGKISEN